MKWILAIMLFISTMTYGQIGRGDDSTKYIRYQNQYGQRMPRSWWDSVAHMPYGDTALFPKPSRPGAIMMHTDKTFYKWNGGGWEAIGSGGSGAPSGPAGGDLAGTYPNPIIASNAVTTSKINNAAVTIGKLSATGTADNTTFLRGDGTWSVPAGGSGVTTMAAIGSSPNNNGATISGSTLNLQPADATHGGVVTSGTQDIAGRKNFLGKTSNFNGYGPRLNTQLLASAKDADSIYVSGKYLGFGFCGVFKSGVRVIVYVKADNHVGGNSIIMIGKSFDQGRTYTADTLINQLHGGVNDTLCTLGGGGIAPDNRLIIFYKRFRFSSPSFFNVDQRIILSDDEGATLYGDQAISHGSNTDYLPYSGLVACANNELLLSWYGQNGSTWSVYTIKSTDGGISWGSATTVFSNTASQRDETTFEHLGGGTIIGLMRGEPTDTLYGQLISYDNGATWTYQGQVSFGIPGTPAWLSTFRSQNGKMAVACYYRNGTEIRALYSYADSVILGPSHWDLSKEVTIATSVQGSGYINICHPYQGMEGWGYYYDETIAQTNATIKWVKVPLGGSFPIGVGAGVSGLTAGRIPVASSATSLTDYSALKYSSSNTAIVLNGATGNTWSAHNGVPLESAHNALLLSDNNYINILDNAYLDTDYKYKTNGAAGILALTSGRVHFYHGNTGSAGGVIALTDVWSMRGGGDMWVNNSAGVSGQVLTSAGSGNPTTWSTVVSSQWATVTGGINFDYSTNGNVGINTTTPAAPLHVSPNTSGGGHHTVIIEDDNSSIGMSMPLGYKSATGTNQKYKGFVMDNNGLNICKYLNNLTGVPTSIAMFTQADNFVVGSTADNAVGKVQVAGKLTVATHAIGSNSDSAVIWDRSTNEYKVAKINGGSASSDLTGAAVKANIHIVNDADYTIASTDYAIVYSAMSADRTLTLPSASSSTNRVLLIKQGSIATRVINLSIALRENSGVTTSALGNGESVTIISDGTDWWIVAHGQ